MDAPATGLPQYHFAAERGEIVEDLHLSDVSDDELAKLVRIADGYAASWESDGPSPELEGITWLRDEYRAEITRRIAAAAPAPAEEG